MSLVTELVTSSGAATVFSSIVLVLGQRHSARIQAKRESDAQTRTEALARETLARAEKREDVKASARADEAALIDQHELQKFATEMLERQQGAIAGMTAQYEQLKAECLERHAQSQNAIRKLSAALQESKHSAAAMHKQLVAAEAELVKVRAELNFERTERQSISETLRRYDAVTIEAERIAAMSVSEPVSVPKPRRSKSHESVVV